jgi:hypothetical protein
MAVCRTNWRALIATLGGLFSMSFGFCAVAQEGMHGDGHGRWHEFYATLKTPFGISCCRDQDCRPTQSRRVGDHYEVKVDGSWMSVSRDVIIDVIAPGGGAHVCAVASNDTIVDVPICVILPPDS